LQKLKIGPPHLQSGMTEARIVQLVTTALESLGVADRVTVASAQLRDSTDWTIALAFDGPPSSIIAPDRDEEQTSAAIRGELRRALRMCPLCQRIGHVEKIRDAEGRQEACAVRCPACGDYEIDQSLIRDLRSAWERGDENVLARLPGVADALRQRPEADRRLRAGDVA
jgi:hypothetical protein